VPNLFVTLEALPLTPTGKVDRRALPTPGDLEPERVAPRDEVELRLARIWEDLLGVRSLGVRDNFFALGGHSLLVVRLMGMIEQQLGLRLPVSALIEAPTVERMARLVRRGTELPRSLVVPIQTGAGRPLFLVHPIGGNVFCYLPLAQPGLDVPLYGIQAPAPGEPWSVEALAERYVDALRAVQPEGPYQLGGWSFGGVVAFEMARRLEARGDEVSLLAMIDVAPPQREVRPEAPVDWARFAEDLRGLAGAGPSEPPVREVPVEGLLDDEATRELFELFRANHKALSSYRPGPYGGRLALIRAEATAAALPDDPDQAWSELAARGAEVHRLSGDHYSLLRPPHAAALSELLGRLLHDAVEAERSLAHLSRNREEGSPLVAL
jgi:thioesterase domain-containing protein